MKAEDIEGYRGKEDIDAILSFIEAEVRTRMGLTNRQIQHVNDTYDWEMRYMSDTSKWHNWKNS